MARTDLVGKVSTAGRPVVNRVLGAEQGSLIRKVIEKTAGISAAALCSRRSPAPASPPGSSSRPRVRMTKRTGRVAVFPTCLVEYQAPAIGKDLVHVYERNGVECSLTNETGCCGAPWLHSGDIENFTKVAVKNVKALADTVRAGKDIVVPQPTCGYVLKKDYLDYVGGPDAQLVAEHTYDAAEYLMKLHKGDDGPLDTNFTGDVPETITYHTPCHLRAQNIGFKSRDLMKLTGAKVKLVQQCSGIDGMWGLRAENAKYSLPIAGKLGEEIERAGGDVVDRRLPSGQHRDHRTDRPGPAPPDPGGRPGLRHPRRGPSHARSSKEQTIVTTTPSSRKLTFADIADVRAYERERADLRARMIDLKRRRRVALGPFVVVMFENRETVRYQIQEMARVERLTTDEAIQAELDAYNPLIPEPGQLCGTLFIELTSDESMQEWLPKLVGIERSLVLRLADGTVVRAVPKRATPRSSPARRSPRRSISSSSSSHPRQVDRDRRRTGAPGDRPSGVPRGESNSRRHGR